MLCMYIHRYSTYTSPCVHVHMHTMYICVCSGTLTAVCGILVHHFVRHTAVPPSPGVPMFVTNTDVFGYLVPSSEKLQSLDEARQAFVNFKLKTLGRREYTVWSCEPCGINIYLLTCIGVGWGSVQ